MEERETRSVSGTAPAGLKAVPVQLNEVEQVHDFRFGTGIAELDRVLGGGIVPGSVTLIGGDPGIGKSTLVLQALAELSASGTALYVSAEESPGQIRLRADRMKIRSDQLLILPATSLEDMPGADLNDGPPLPDNSPSPEQVAQQCAGCRGGPARHVR